MKIIFLLLAGILLSFSLHRSHAILPDESGLIEIHGQKRRMIGHIFQAKLDSFEHKENPFFHTNILRYISEKKKFIRTGNILETKEEDLKEIYNHNYVYIPFYAWARTSQRHGQYVPLAAIIVGTKDTSTAEKLNDAICRY